MWIYFILLSAVIIFPCYSKKYLIINESENKMISSKKIYFFVITLLLVLVAGLRSTLVGIDLRHHYASNYYLYGTMPWSAIKNFGLEVGIFVLSKFLNLFSLDVQWFIFVTSFLSLTPILIFLFKESKDFKVSVILFITYCIYYQHFNQIQQEIAVSFVLLAILFLNKKNYFGYICMTILAASFHTTALLTFALFFMRHINVNWKTIPLFLVGVAVALVCLNPLFTLFAKIFPEYAWYSNNLTHGVGDKSLGVYISIILSFCLFAWSIYNLLFRKINNKRYQFLILCSFVYFCSQLFTLNMIVLNRVGYYFLPFCLILCSENISLIKDNQSRFLLRLGICSMMIVYFVYITIFWGEISYGVVPYMFL